MKELGTGTVWSAPGVTSPAHFLGLLHASRIGWMKLVLEQGQATISTGVLLNEFW